VNERRVAVVGAGTAGCATALFLARDGHHVEVFEQADEPGPIGAGILLQPGGLKVLERLGVDEEVRDRGAPVTRLRCRTASGRTLIDVPGDGVGIHRGTLFEALYRPLEPAGVGVHTGRRIEHADELPDFDLVVAADGAHSALRGTPGRPYPYGALWFVGDRGDLAPDTLDQVVHGTRFLAGALPTGRDQASLFLSVRADRPPPPDWRETLREHHPAAAGLAGQELRVARYLDVVMPELVDGRVVFVGDAGHAMSPQLGQGATLALRDAEVLADCLRRNALAGFSTRRRGQLRLYGFASRWMTPFFQSGRDRLALPRDALLGPLGRLPGARHAMRRLMSGTTAR
jgi:FAD-dependent urate hydroxylase